MLWRDPNTHSMDLWSRKLRAWEIEEVCILNDIVESITLSPGEDRLLWSRSGKPYTCKDGRLSFLNDREVSDQRWSFIWSIKVPPKVLIFFWKFGNGKLPTKYLLQKRIQNLSVNLWCPFCQSSWETHVHLLWNCPRIRIMWAHIFDWWGLTSSFYKMRIENIWEWHKLFSNSILQECWKTALSASLWSFWLCRNQLVFENISIRDSDLLFLIKLRALKWCEAFNICKNRESRSVDGESGWPDTVEDSLQ
ncbi:hypothetical protein POM88_046537 [Heracleum sosnowskyi]|uniref:Reverse transcriptase zinc-binding domain-containing protein n=1 Tax=Heracleum sosnowskyi TaxID=360622 RepID=A0AAD8H8N1_9APIA|nr:hypothetical protein POM88_046537 [Heracleum sosnowskyi]